MRPVLLRMDGFAAFREPTAVDFSGADFFVLVGPTGAGKSTVIDAMTFALYGSVPRWDDRRTVSLALAPTAGRGTVSLVFDAGGERYVAARELRRAASGSVTVREARLERLVDPSGTAGPDEDTVPVADGAPKVTAAVEELLGLPFEDFCTCVVLPQGDFADFLHAAPNRRQEKLERILGLGVYDLVMRRANSEASAQQQRADVLAERLARYDGDTREAQDAAARRVARVEEIRERVTAALPRLAAVTAELASAGSAAAAAVTERDALAVLRVPDGVAGLDARRVRDGERAEAARTRAETAEHADSQARAARSAAPDRAGLELVRAQHAEVARLAADRPALDAALSASTSDGSAAAADVAAAVVAEDAARSTRDDALAASGAAAAAVATLAAERDALQGPHLLDGLDDIAARRDAASVELASHAQALAVAESADEAARAAVAAAPEREPLEQARRDHDALAAARTALAGAQTARQRAVTDDSGTAARRDAARHHLAHARAALAEAERTDLAATLRPALVEGDDCPVCAQPVATPPPPLPDGGVAAARQAAGEAEDADRSAQEAHHGAAAAARTAGRDADRAAGEVARLEAVLDGWPDADGVRAALAGRDRLTADADAAAAALRTARRGRDAAGERVAALREETDAVASRLRAAREPLTGLGPPAEPDDPVAGWRALVAWAAGQADARDAALGPAREQEAAALRAGTTTEAALAAARDATSAARGRETAAVRAEQEARSALAAADGRAAELRAALDGAPSDPDAAAELERVAELDRRAAAADVELRDAREALRSARGDAERTGREIDAARAELRRARDPVVALGAPVPDGTDLGPAWAALTAWAADGISAREDRIRAAEQAADTARTARDDLLDGLRSGLRALALLSAPAPGDRSAQAGGPGRPAPDGGPGSGPSRGPDRADPTAPPGPLDPVPPDAVSPDTVSPDTVSPDAPADEIAARAPAAVATALADARAAHARISDRRAEAAELAEEHAAARENQQVAKMLGDQLRSDRFPRWLVASALDALVVDASQSLDVLSGGQFALTHDKGEFLVVDRTDADARRPVKTLSGGETFQASLALALALSDQLSGLAARGAPRLESIFLDEGFGTLDEANLETVASTLENLATRGDRMVGVITHVAALAERIPVRYTLRRTQRTSTIERADRGVPG